MLLSVHPTPDPPSLGPMSHSSWLYSPLTPYTPYSGSPRLLRPVLQGWKLLLLPTSSGSGLLAAQLHPKFPLWVWLICFQALPLFPHAPPPQAVQLPSPLAPGHCRALGGAGQTEVGHRALTWGWRQSAHIWLDVRWKGWLNVLAGGQVRGDAAPGGHGGRGIPWNR